MTIFKAFKTANADESEQRFRSFIESANDFIYTLTPTGIITYVAPNVEELLGYHSDELVGKSFAPLIHPDDLQICMVFLQKVMESRTKQHTITIADCGG